MALSVTFSLAPFLANRKSKKRAPCRGDLLLLLAHFQHGMFVGQHGSWNRKPHSGYKVIFVPFSGGQPTAEPVVDVLTGFSPKRAMHRDGQWA